MNAFYEHLLSSPFEFVLIQLLSGIIYYFLFRRYIFSIFDPLFISFLLSSFGTSVVCFLRLTGETNTFYFSSYLLTQVAFVIGFLSIKPISKKNSFQSSFRNIKDDMKIIKILYTLSIFLFILSHVISYLKLGIPIFNKYGRLATYASGGGLGILSRIISITRPIILIYTLHKYSNSKLNLINKLVLVIFLVTAFLSGSKSAILEILFISVLFQYFQWKSNINLSKLDKLRKIFAVSALIGAILIISISAANQSTEKSPIVILLYRFINSGDVFMYAYTSNVLDNIPKASGFTAIFSDFFGFTRIIPYDKLPDALGMQIWQTYHNNFNYFMGPNPRHNVFGLHYFGFYGSIIYSFSIGLVSSFFRNSLFRILPIGLISFTIYILFSPLVDLRVDSTMQLSNLTNIIFIFFPLLMFSVIVNEIQKKISADLKNKSRVRIHRKHKHNRTYLI